MLCSQKPLLFFLLLSSQRSPLASYKCIGKVQVERVRVRRSEGEGKVRMRVGRSEG